MSRSIRSILVLSLLLTLVYAGAVHAQVASTYPADGAERVLNYTPIEIEFASVVQNAEIQLTPAVEGTMQWQETTLVFLPAEKFQPNTEYEVAVSWDGGQTSFHFTSINEVEELYFQDFSGYALGTFPNDWVSIEPGDQVNFTVVEFDQARSGRALMGRDGGKEHTHLVMPPFRLANANSSILVETTVWLDNSEASGIYLWDALPAWPPYAHVAAAGTLFGSPERQEYVVTIIYRLADQKIELYVDHKPFNLPADGFRNAPVPGQRRYSLGMYFRGANHSSEVYWTDVRIAEIAD